MSFKLSKRLRTIVDLCDKSNCIVDIGTDHGFVPITIANENIAKKVIATDIKKDPIDICNNNIKKFLLDKNFDIQTKVCDGLSCIDKKNNVGIIISGMGYDSIKEILSNIDEYNYTFLILSPQTKVNEFIQLMDKKKIMIDNIVTVFEDDKCYFIFKCYNKKIYDRLYGEVDEG